MVTATQIKQTAPDTRAIGLLHQDALSTATAIGLKPKGDAEGIGNRVQDIGHRKGIIHAIKVSTLAVKPSCDEGTVGTRAVIFF